MLSLKTGQELEVSGPELGTGVGGAGPAFSIVTKACSFLLAYLNFLVAAEFGSKLTRIVLSPW